MAEKKMTVVVCDFPHKGHDLPAVRQVTIDVCSRHATMFDGALDAATFECPDCGRSFKSQSALTHHRTVTHGAAPSSRSSRKRGRANPSTSKVQAQTRDEVCPECGLKFKNKLGLGIHRSRIHGIKGPARTRKEKKQEAPEQPALAVM